MSAIDVKVDTEVSGLGEDVANHRFELGVESSAAEAELMSWLCCACSTPEAAKKRSVSLYICTNKRTCHHPLSWGKAIRG